MPSLLSVSAVIPGMLDGIGCVYVDVSIVVGDYSAISRVNIVVIIIIVGCCVVIFYVALERFPATVRPW